MKMALLFGVCFFLYLLKLSAGSGFSYQEKTNPAKLWYFSNFSYIQLIQFVFLNLMVINLYKSTHLAIYWSKDWTKVCNIKPCYHHNPSGWKPSLVHKQGSYFVGYACQNITILCFSIKHLSSLSGVNISPKWCDHPSIVIEWKGVWCVLANFA